MSRNQGVTAPLTAHKLEEQADQNIFDSDLEDDQETKACVFLATTSSLPTAPGVCSVYDSRPLGCRMYPVILDNDDSAILDDLCPHKSEFDIPSEEDAHRLLNFESKL